MDERSEKVSGLLNEAGETHHIFFRITDGADEDWATFYSDWLVNHSELSNLLGSAPPRSHLTHALVQCDLDYQAEKPDQSWQDWWAARLVERFG